MCSFFRGCNDKFYSMANPAPTIHRELHNRRVWGVDVSAADIMRVARTATLPANAPEGSLTYDTTADTLNVGDGAAWNTTLTFGGGAGPVTADSVARFDAAGDLVDSTVVVADNGDTSGVRNLEATGGTDVSLSVAGVGSRLELNGVAWPDAGTGATGEILRYNPGPPPTLQWGTATAAPAPLPALNALARFSDAAGTIDGSATARLDADGDLSGIRGLVANGAGAAAITLNGMTWPVADGAANQTLTTDGAGTLSWQTLSSLWDVTTESGAQVVRMDDATYPTTVMCYGSTTPWDTGTGSRMYFDETTGAFRAGTTTGAQWASPGGCSISLGHDGEAPATYSATVGGTTHTIDASSDGAVILGGARADIDANALYSAVVGGVANEVEALAAGAVVLGGLEGSARFAGQIVSASGMFAAAGDAQGTIQQTCRAAADTGIGTATLLTTHRVTGYATDTVDYFSGRANMAEGIDALIIGGDNRNSQRYFGRITALVVCGASGAPTVYDSTATVLSASAGFTVRTEIVPVAPVTAGKDHAYTVEIEMTAGVVGGMRWVSAMRCVSCVAP